MDFEESTYWFPLEESKTMSVCGYILVPPDEHFSVCACHDEYKLVRPQQLWGSFFWCTSMATHENFMKTLPQQLWGSGKNISHWVSLSLTRALSHTLYILSLTLSLTTTLPLSHSLSFTLTKMIGENYLFCRHPGSH